MWGKRKSIEKNTQAAKHFLHHLRTHRGQHIFIKLWHTYSMWEWLILSVRAEHISCKGSTYLMLGQRIGGVWSNKATSVEMVACSGLLLALLSHYRTNKPHTYTHTQSNHTKPCCTRSPSFTSHTSRQTKSIAAKTAPDKSMPHRCKDRAG